MSTEEEGVVAGVATESRAAYRGERAIATDDRRLARRSGTAQLDPDATSGLWPRHAGGIRATDSIDGTRW